MAFPRQRHPSFDPPTRPQKLSTKEVQRHDSAVAPQREGIVPFPGLPPPSARIVELVSFAETAGFLACCCEAAGLAVLETFEFLRQYIFLGLFFWEKRIEEGRVHRK